MVKRFRFSGLVLALAVILMTACNYPNPSVQKPTSTPIPSPTTALPTADTRIPDNSAQCVVGTWEMQDIASFLNTNLPKDFLPANLQVEFTDTQGHLRYIFDPAGKVTAAADNFQVNANAKMGPLTLAGTGDVKGSGSAAYTVNENSRTIEMTNLADHGFTLSATIAGNEVLPETPIDSLIWFGSGDNSAASLAYTCTGNQLTFTFNINGAANNPQTVTLVRFGS